MAMSACACVHVRVDCACACTWWHVFVHVCVRACTHVHPWPRMQASLLSVNDCDNPLRLLSCSLINPPFGSLLSAMPPPSPLAPPSQMPFALVGPDAGAMLVDPFKGPLIFAIGDRQVCGHTDRVVAMQWAATKPASIQRCRASVPNALIVSVPLVLLLLLLQPFGVGVGGSAAALTWQPLTRSL